MAIDDDVQRLMLFPNKRKKLEYSTVADSSVNTINTMNISSRINNNVIEYTINHIKNYTTINIYSILFCINSTRRDKKNDLLNTMKKTKEYNNYYNKAVILLCHKVQ